MERCYDNAIKIYTYKHSYIIIFNTKYTLTLLMWVAQYSVIEDFNPSKYFCIPEEIFLQEFLVFLLKEKSPW